MLSRRPLVVAKAVSIVVGFEESCQGTWRIKDIMRYQNHNFDTHPVHIHIQLFVTSVIYSLKYSTMHKLLFNKSFSTNN